MAAIMRLLLALLCVLGLALAPVTANASAVPSNGMAKCMMDGEMPDMPADHSKMDCCTPVCQAPAPAAALLPDSGASSGARTAPTVKLTGAPAKELAGITSSGLDPPPRA